LGRGAEINPFPPRRLRGIQVFKRLRAIRRTDQGFTLTELLIVIVILGVLTGIVVLAVGQFSNRGEVSACKAAVKTTEVAVENYRANNSGTLPTDLNALIPDYLRTHPNTSKYTVEYYPSGRPAPPSASLPVLSNGAVIGYLGLPVAAGAYPTSYTCS
jgi:prepilin-type N-terminal cleavage/methylation domain-containing protein